jgi:hypothetical protein
LPTSPPSTMDAGFIKYTINFHSAKFLLSNVYQESSSPYQRPRHAQAKNMPKYVPMLEGIMHDPKGSALCLLTLGSALCLLSLGGALCLLFLGHISAYDMDNTILLLLLFFFKVNAGVCQNNGQFQVWELNICYCYY